MIKTLVRFLLSLVAAVCIVVALFCPWGFLCSFEPGQEAWRVLYPVIFVGACLLGGLSSYLARRAGDRGQRAKPTAIESDTRV